MNCDEIKELYLLSLRAVLAPEEAEQLHNHVTSCDTCRKTILVDKAIVSGIQKIPPAAPRDEFISVVCKQLFIKKEYIRLSFRHLLIFSLGLLVIFAAMGILWQDFLFNVFTFIYNHSLSNFAAVTDNIQNLSKIVLTASSYQKTMTQLPYHLSYVFWIIFVSSVLFLISLLFSFSIYPSKKSIKHFII